MSENIHRFIENLVNGCPDWLKQYFEEDKIRFILEDDGELALECHNSMPKKDQKKARKLIARYFEEGKHYDA